MHSILQCHTSDQSCLGHQADHGYLITGPVAMPSLDLRQGSYEMMHLTKISSSGCSCPSTLSARSLLWHSTVCVAQVKP